MFKKSFQIMTCWTIVVFSMAAGFVTTPQSGTGKTSCRTTGRIPILLVVVEADDFSCPLCLESWMSLLDSLRVRSWNGIVCGVLSFPSPVESDLSYGTNMESILEKQLIGFEVGWCPDFPFLLDREHVFSSVSPGKSRIVLIDPRSGLIRQWALPISPENQFALFHELNGSDRDKP